MWVCPSVVCKWNSHNSWTTWYIYPIMHHSAGNAQFASDIGYWLIYVHQGPKTLWSVYILVKIISFFRFYILLLSSTYNGRKLFHVQYEWNCWSIDIHSWKLGGAMSSHDLINTPFSGDRPSAQKPFPLLLLLLLFACLRQGIHLYCS